MPEEQEPDEVQPAQPPFVLQMPLNVPTFYASGWTTRIGQSDFTMQLGLNPSENSDGNLEPVATVVLTHGNLFKLAMHLATATRILQKLYGDNRIPILADLDRDKFDKAVEEVEAEQLEMHRQAAEQSKKAQAGQKVG